MTLPFYLRSKDEREVKAGKFTLVKIQLNDKDLKTTIISILKTCNLPTTFVDKIEEPARGKKDEKKFWEASGGFKRGVQFSDLEDDPLYQSIFMRRKMNTQIDTFKWAIQITEITKC